MAAPTKRDWSALIQAVARELRLPPRALAALVAVESGGDPHAVGPVGEIGLLQVRPETAQAYGVEPSRLTDPETNLRVGGQHLRELLRRYHGSLELAIAAYNAGAQNIDRAIQLVRERGVAPSLDAVLTALGTITGRWAAVTRRHVARVLARIHEMDRPQAAPAEAAAVDRGRASAPLAEVPETPPESDTRRGRAPAALAEARRSGTATSPGERGRSTLAEVLREPGGSPRVTAEPPPMPLPPRVVAEAAPARPVSPSPETPEPARARGSLEFVVRTAPPPAEPPPVPPPPFVARGTLPRAGGGGGGFATEVSAPPPGPSPEGVGPPPMTPGAALARLRALLARPEVPPVGIPPVAIPLIAPEGGSVRDEAESGTPRAPAPTPIAVGREGGPVGREVWLWLARVFAPPMMTDQYFTGPPYVLPQSIPGGLPVYHSER